MSSSSEQIALLIELHEKHTCLYIVKHPDYHNKNKRSMATAQIVEGLKDVRPNVSGEQVQKKILGLRTSYAQERRKVFESLRSGMGEEEVRSAAD
ncbi:unnamed protein product [Acanthoscelides obtectus]|uniref:MADF domain-containing protein n=1 Tax=Acanthoscelides obtectus TaxID=200917 RepID=A0A9P0P5X1_ACAOB|nr:unnamed protein product [Acanthoscelides obtectus]CAK1646687.1 hypothetical protein AOBTE_LOCUS14816 [Acanthoscelides obtectus]